MDDMVVRLESAEVERIKAVVREVYGPSAEVRLFGSRVDDRLKGGDIDLHLTVDRGMNSFDREIELRRRLLETLGEQKIDVVVHALDEPLMPIDRIALREGMVL